jgi:hypothetical protein
MDSVGAGGADKMSLTADCPVLLPDSAPLEDGLWHPAGSSVSLSFSSSTTLGKGVVTVSPKSLTTKIRNEN